MGGIRHVLDLSAWLPCCMEVYMSDYCNSLRVYPDNERSYWWCDSCTSDWPIEGVTRQEFINHLRDVHGVKYARNLKGERVLVSGTWKNGWFTWEFSNGLRCGEYRIVD